MRSIFLWNFVSLILISNICFLYLFDFLREDQDNDKNSDDENEGKFFRTFAENLSHLVWLSDHYSA